MWIVTNRKTGEVKTYKTAKEARRARDKADAAYGAYVCTVKEVINTSTNESIK
jgi:hypothetical protein